MTTIWRKTVIVLLILYSAIARTQNWTEIFPSTPPTPRQLHSMAYDASRGQIVLFGGLFAGGMNDTWVWDGQNWTRRFPSNAPIGRSSASMAYDAPRGQVVLFGGNNSNAPLGDTWVWDGGNWEQAHPLHSPTPRWSAAMAYDPLRGNVVLFGGFDQVSAFSDTWIWNGSDWKKIKTATQPSSGGFNAMVHDSGNRVLFLYASIDQQTWEWTGTSWLQVVPSMMPSSRFGPGITDDPVAGEVILFGGFFKTPFDDTWAWNGSDWTHLSPIVSPIGRGNSPLVFDGMHGNILLFAGAGQNYYGDTWTLSSFPLTNSPLKGIEGSTDLHLDPYTIPVISVFDHTMRNSKGKFHVYGFDGEVQGFTGEIGSCSPAPDCAVKRGGYSNSSGGPFGVNGHYVGVASDGGATKLQYEGHPGFDYYAACQKDRKGNCVYMTGTNVYAAAAGTIHYPDTLTGACAAVGCAAKYHALQLIPTAASYLQLNYLHLSTYGGPNPTQSFTATDPSPALGCSSSVILPLPEGTQVGAGCLIAHSGNTSPTYVGPHLHFEVQRVLPSIKLPASSQCIVDDRPVSCVPVDPYGGLCGTDPYYPLTQIQSVPLWNFRSYLSTGALCFASIGVGSSDEQFITLTNIAVNNLTSISSSLSPPGQTDFSEMNTCTGSLAPGQSCQLAVRFTPFAAGSRTATLTISGQDNSTNVSPNLRLVVNLSGTGH